jgi:hypothetical protein
MQSGQSHDPGGFLNLSPNPRTNVAFEEDVGVDLAANTGLLVPQARQCFREFRFLTTHVPHSQVSLAGLNLLPKPETDTAGCTASFP